MKLEVVLKKAEMMWEEARVKRLHGADVPSDPGRKRAREQQNISRNGVLYYFAASFNLATY